MNRIRDFFEWMEDEAHPGLCAMFLIGGIITAVFFFAFVFSLNTFLGAIVLTGTLYGIPVLAYIISQRGDDE